jgi:hypothetical protein
MSVVASQGGGSLPSLALFPVGYSRSVLRMRTACLIA